MHIIANNVFFFQVEDLRSDTEESDTQLVDSETVELNGNVCKESINTYSDD